MVVPTDVETGRQEDGVSAASKAPQGGKGADNLFLIVVCSLVCLVVGFGAGVGTGAGIWKDGSSSSGVMSPGDSLLAQNLTALEAFFDRVDSDQSGLINASEVASGAKSSWNTTLGEDDQDRMLSLLDEDGDGMISRSEFLNQIDEAVEGGLGNSWVGCGWNNDTCYNQRCTLNSACWFSCGNAGMGHRPNCDKGR